MEEVSGTSRGTGEGMGWWRPGRERERKGEGKEGSLPAHFYGAYAADGL